MRLSSYLLRGQGMWRVLLAALCITFLLCAAARAQAPYPQAQSYGASGPVIDYKWKTPVIRGWSTS
jgi:hypothetical protein